MTVDSVIPFSLRDAPAIIERLLPVQKLSAEAYKEQMANVGKTLTALGSYWKGRKPLILAKACVLGSLLPATDDLARDLAIFEKLMGMDDESFVVRWKRRPRPIELLAKLTIGCITDYFTLDPQDVLPDSAPVDWSLPGFSEVKVAWRSDITELERRRLEAQLLPQGPYRERVVQAKRPEEVWETVHDHIWEAVNAHLGTKAQNFVELVEQLGVMRFGHRPRLADTFCGSGQIPFEAARLGCDVYASDLNPVACMLTWGAFNIVGGGASDRVELEQQQQQLVEKVQDAIDDLNVDTDGAGWRAKSFLYCLEARCPQSGWLVPLLPSLVVGDVDRAIAELVPDAVNRRYDIVIRSGVSQKQFDAAAEGTIGRESRFGDAYLIHRVNGVTYKTKISTLRGDYQRPDGTTANRLRMWGKSDVRPNPNDVFQERLYAVHWTRPKKRGRTFEYEFRSVTSDDLRREHTINKIVDQHIEEWQSKGWVPDMRIEPGGPPRYEGLNLIRTRGWTHWHHVFNPRQLLYFAFMKRELHGHPNAKALCIFFAKALDWNSKLCRWYSRWEKPENVFYNQALNGLYNYGTRGFGFMASAFLSKPGSFPLANLRAVTACGPASDLSAESDIYITDPPYGDAVRYEEVLDFFIAWLRKDPPPEFAGWVWDSRRALAVKGEDESFRRGMVAAYTRMTECMPQNGIQVIMFTHQSGSIWADMANIVWASGLHVTAAWYVVTETDSALREGSYVKGTVLLVLRKRLGVTKTTRDDLAWEIQEEVESQVRALAGLNDDARGLYRDENVFEDADIQMAGYAAALRVLTRYAVIDGRDMAAEAIRPRVRGETTFVDGLIAFAVDTANQCLVPQGLVKSHWDKLTGAERFYLKILDLEARGAKTLDNYQNFAKAFKVRDFKPFLASQKANDSRLKGAVEFGRAEMGEGSELHQSILRAVLYAVMELAINIDGNEVLAHLTLNVPNYYGDMTQRQLAVELADYLAKRLENLRPDEASAARVLRELVKSQRIG